LGKVSSEILAASQYRFQCFWKGPLRAWVVDRGCCGEGLEETRLGEGVKGGGREWPEAAGVWRGKLKGEQWCQKQRDIQRVVGDLLSISR
jgi:hypothetical protein